MNIKVFGVWWKVLELQVRKHKHFVLKLSQNDLIIYVRINIFIDIPSVTRQLKGWREIVIIT